MAGASPIPGMNDSIVVHTSMNRRIRQAHQKARRTEARGHMHSVWEDREQAAVCSGHQVHHQHELRERKRKAQQAVQQGRQTIEQAFAAAAKKQGQESEPTVVL